MTLRLAALDLSLSGTGVAFTAGIAGTGDYPVAAHTVRSGKLTGHRRLDHILVTLAGYGLAHAQLVVIEDAVAHGPNGGTTLALAELHGLVKQWLYNADVPYVLVSPKTRAMYATGNGNARKELVLSSVRTTYASSVAFIDNDDEGDSLAMLALALDAYGAPLAHVPDTCRRAVGRVDWPVLRGRRPDAWVPDFETPGGAAAAIAGPVREQLEMLP